MTELPRLLEAVEDFITAAEQYRCTSAPAADKYVAFEAAMIRARSQLRALLPIGADVSSRLQQLETAAMLKDRTRRAIRERAQAGESHAALAEDFGVPEAFVTALCDWQLFADDTHSRVAQLEQEKATLQKENSRKEAIRQCLDQDIHLLVGEKKLLVAALAETREALQELRKRFLHHQAECSAFGSASPIQWHESDADSCTCGLAAVIKKIEVSRHRNG